MDSGWLAYTCDSGNVLFFSNKYTDEYKWISCCCPRNNYNNYYNNNNNMVLQGAQHITTDQLLCKGPSLRSIGTDASFPLPRQPSKQLRTQGTQTDVRDLGPCVLAKSNIFCLEDANGNPVNNISIQTVTREEPRTLYDPPPDTPVIIKVNKRKLYPCDQCEKVLSAYALLVKHINICHTKEKPSEELNTMADKAEQVVFASPPVSDNSVDKPQVDQVKCFQCETILPSMEAFDEHFTLHYDDLNCKGCKKVFGCNKTYRNHLSIHFGVKHKCSRCSKKFVMKVGLLRHIKNLHAGMWNDSMRAELNRIEQLAMNDSHNRNHNKNINHENSHDSIMRENNATVNPKPQVSFKCDACGAGYALFADLTKHKETCPKIQKDHKTSNQEYNSKVSKLRFWCSKCNVVLKNKKTFQRHIRHSKIHHSQGSEHEKGSKSQSLNSKSNNGIKSFECHHCRKSFKDYGSMHWHMKYRCHIAPNTNTNMVCGYCSVNFKNRVQLSKHWATHISPNEKGLYQCDHCSKTVETQDKLPSHLYYHLTLFTCNLCDKKYHSIKELRTHYQTKHKEGVSSQAGKMVEKTAVSAKPQYTCSLCGASFSKTRNQKIHLKRCRKKQRLAAVKQAMLNKKTQSSESCSQATNTTTAAPQETHDATSTQEEEQATNEIPVDVHQLQEEQIDCKMPTDSAATATSQLGKSNKKSDKKSHSLRDRKSPNNVESSQQESPAAVKETNFNCSDCKKCFPNMFALKRHEELTKHGEQQKKLLKKRFKCKVCKKSFHLYSVFYHHQMQHNKQSAKHPCRLCKTSFSTHKALALHKCGKSSSVINGRRTYHCQMCESSFDSGQGLSNHKRAHLVNDSKDCNQCIYCGKVFENGKRLKKHICPQKLSKKLLIDTNEGKNASQFECGDCGKFLSSKRSLQRHKESRMCSHTSTSTETELKINCQNCSKRFSNFPEFISHHNTAHGPGKPCWLCSKDFSNYSNLHRHIRDVHADTKQLFCPYCSKEFHNVSVYTKHTSKSGQKHQCPQCDMSFAMCLHLTEHINSIH